MSWRAEWWNALHHPAHTGCRQFVVLSLIGALVFLVAVAVWTLR